LALQARKTGSKPYPALGLKALDNLEAQGNALETVLFALINFGRAGEGRRSRCADPWYDPALSGSAHLLAEALSIFRCLAPNDGALHQRKERSILERRLAGESGSRRKNPESAANSGSRRKNPESAVKLWGPQEESGERRKTLGATGRIWRAPQNSGSRRKNLESAVKLWEPPEESGERCKTLGAAGRIWRAL
jgi:hypothetical protein